MSRDETMSQAMQDLIDARQQRKAQERAKDAEIDAALRQIGARHRREQEDRDAQAQWEALSETARDHLTESVQAFGSNTVTALWRRWYDAAFVLPLHLRGIAGNAEE